MTAAHVSPADVPFAGQSVEFGGKTWVVPPLALGAIQRLRPVIARLGTQTATSGMDELDDLLLIVHSALVRNYPALTREALGECLTLLELPPVVDTVLAVSGFVNHEDAAGNG